jgi:aldehyde dehydrogenase (NAD+)
MYNTGQSCDAPTRLLVERSCYADALEIAKKAAMATQVGDPEQEGDHIGPLFDRIQFNRVQTMIGVGIDEGATVLAGGLRKTRRHGFRLVC